MPIQTATQGIVNETGGVSHPFMFRNRIQNGEININQRAVANTTNTAANLSGVTSIDRWRSEHYNIGGSFNPNVSIKQTADHPVKGSKGYCLEIQCNTTGTTANNVDFFSMSHRIEAQNISDVFSGSNAQPMTLSFWVKSNKPGTYCLHLRDEVSVTGGYISIWEYTIVQSNVWEKKVINIPKPTYSSMPSTNVSGLGINFHYASGLTPTYNPALAPAVGAWHNSGTQGAATVNQTNLFTTAGNYHRLTDVQLEVGTSDTPFERRPYSVELQLCQRYLHVWSSEGYSYRWVGVGFTGTNTAQAHYRFPVIMRAAPSVSFSEQNKWIIDKADGAFTSTAMEGSWLTAEQCRINITVASGVSGGQPTAIANNGDAGTRYIRFSSEI